ncbi:DUF4832 domain-containing protein [Neorhodopirellula pilleata]|uniref:DUF4832 domain-containing protein n=1 Tax=Neorhodopirellula pilleata TaxID=2714738 RepID=A0A5C6ALI3_9BACT|nr:DUF4832 domain-containing protein [Neorhodopirellula pilleata]TWT99033.1 hypothetical protein Pla100_22070 [Neorhodopirellula pilleata]
MKTSVFFKSVLLHCTLSICSIWVSFASGQSTTTESISLRSEIRGVQPMTGIVLWHDHEQAASDAISLEYRYCGYDEIVMADGTYDFASIDRVLDQIAGRGHQAILRFRFVYPGKPTTVPEYVRSQPGYQETIGKSEGEKTWFCDWSHQGLQDFTLEFYTRFAERYDRDPRIAFLQTGFGLWAEYHIYDGPRQLGATFPDKAFQDRFLRHLDATLKSLPWSISVDAADNDYSPIEDNETLLKLNFGVFDDSFLCKEHPKYNSVNWRILDIDRWRRAPGGGEFSYYNRRDQKLALSENGPNGVSFEDAARQFHISYMIGNDQPEFQSIQRIREASMATGYRFRINRAQYRPIGSDQASVMIELTNEGVAPIYREAYLAAGKIRSARSLRGLLPGETQTFRIDSVPLSDVDQITIQSDFILPTQTISYSASTE